MRREKSEHPLLKYVACCGKERIYDGCARCIFEVRCLEKSWEHFNLMVRIGGKV